MPARSFRIPLNRNFHIAYAIGVILCLICPTILQVNLDIIITPILGLPNKTIQSIGYTFTGLVLVCILFVMLRWNRVRYSFSKLAEDEQSLAVLRETVLYSIIFSSSALFGATYYLLGGAPVKYFARNFINITPVIYFIFVPRLHAWHKAKVGYNKK